MGNNVSNQKPDLVRFKSIDIAQGQFTKHIQSASITQAQWDWFLNRTEGYGFLRIKTDNIKNPLYVNINSIVCYELKN